jgi:hypothetical protein
LRNKIGATILNQMAKQYALDKYGTAPSPVETVGVSGWKDELTSAEMPTESVEWELQDMIQQTNNELPSRPNRPVRILVHATTLRYNREMKGIPVMDPETQDPEVVISYMVSELVRDANGKVTLEMGELCPEADDYLSRCRDYHKSTAGANDASLTMGVE